MPDGLPICQHCQRVMLESLTGVAVIFLDLKKKPALIRYADSYECPTCHRKFLTGYAPYKAYATDPNFKDELDKAKMFEVQYIFAKD